MLGAIYSAGIVCFITNRLARAARRWIKTCKEWGVGASLWPRMASSNQTVGLENPELPTPDGPTPSADSPETTAQPPESQPPSEPQIVADAGGRKPMSPDQRQLKLLGLTKKAAMKLIGSAVKDPDKFLNTRVTARVNLVNYANSLEEMRLAQRKASVMGRDLQLDPRVRVAALQTVAQLGMAIARTCEANLSNAKNLDDPENDGDSPKTTMINAQNAFIGFPPVADVPKRSLPDMAKTGNDDE